MPQVQIAEGRHLTADEYDAQGRLVRKGQLYYAGETIPNLPADQYATLVTDPKTKDTKRFTDKGKS